MSGGTEPGGAQMPAPAAAPAGGPSLDEQLQDEQTVKRFAKFLHASIPLREALQLQKRVNYFRGKKLMEALLSGAPHKHKPVCATEEDAKKVGLALLRMGLIHASEVADKKKKELRPIREVSAFSEDGFYTWIYEGSKTMRNFMLALLVIAITGMCMFPIWPQSAKVGIWYVSVTLLIFLFVLFSLRLVLYIVFWTVGFEVWILPNFFDEDLGVADSFRPVYSFSKGADLSETWYFRAAGLALLAAFGYWCSQQPTEFDELYAQQMDFLAELYDGKLLGDGSQTAEEQAAGIGAVPKLEDLEREIAEDDGGDDDELGDVGDELGDDDDMPAAGDGEGGSDQDDEWEDAELTPAEEAVAKKAKEALNPDSEPLEGVAGDEAGAEQDDEEDVDI